MFASEVNLLWTVLVVTFLFFTLTATIGAILVLNQRRRLREQAETVENLLKEITERERAQNELAMSEGRYRSLVENINGMYCILDGAFRVVYVSPNMLETIGLALEEMLGKPFTAFIDREDRARVADFYAGCAHRGVVDTSSTFRLSSKGGGTLWVEQRTRIRRDEDGTVTEYRSVLRDVTEQRRAQDSLRTLSQKIIVAQEAERRRVARELHDGIVQLLSSIRFRLQTGLNGSGKGKARVGETIALLDNAIEEVRRISHRLRPSSLDDLGLVPALRIMCEEFAAKTGIVVDVRLPETLGRTSKAVELALFRTIQEALNNVEKHSGATQLTVRVEEQGSYIEARIADNGRGFKAAPTGKAGRQSGGMGLEGMQERISFLGGSVDVSSEPHRGVHICLRLPHKERQAIES